MPAKNVNVGTDDLGDTERAVGFAEACERLDRIDFGNFGVIKLTPNDVKTIRSLLIISGALYEYRDINKKTVKIFRNLAATEEQLSMLANRPRSITYIRANRQNEAERPVEILEIEQ